MKAVTLWLFVLLVSVSGITNPAWGQSCGDWSPHPAVVGELRTPGSSLSLALYGSHAYVADGWSGVQVLLADPVNPRIVNTLFEEELALEVQVHEDRLYVRQRDQIRILSLLDPEIPEPVGAIAAYEPFAPGEDVVFGGLRFEEEDNFVVVSTPGGGVLASMTFPGQIHDIVAEGPYAYVVVGPQYSDAVHRLYVLDVSDPMSPRELGKVDLTATPRRISKLGERLYVTTRWSSTGGVHIVDVAEPSQPQVVSVGPSHPYLDRFVASGDRGYGVNPGLWVYNLSDRDRPEFIGNASYSAVPGAPLSPSGTTYDLELQGNYVFVTQTNGGLKVYDVSTPESHDESTTVVDFPKGAMLVQVDGHGLVGSSAGLHVYDLSDPSRPRLVQNLLTEAVTSLAEKNHLLAAGTRPDGEPELILFDVDDPSQPTELGRTPVLGWIRDMVWEGRYLYASLYNVERSDLWMAVIDIQAPSEPQVVEEFPLNHYVGFEGTTWAMTQLVLSGDYLFATTYRGFRVYSLEDPVAPVSVFSYSLPYHLSSDLAIQEERLYLTMNCRWEWYNPPPSPEAPFAPGLRIFDISDPRAPVEIGFFRTPSGANTLRMRDQAAFVAVSTSGFHAVDVRDPGHPKARGYWMTDDTGNFDLVGEHLYAFQVDRYSPVSLRVTGLPCSVVPVSLLRFTAEIVENHVRLLWELAEDPGLTTFRLIGRQGDEEWEVTAVTRTKTGFEAMDPLGPRRGSLEYVLSERTRDGAWLELGRRAIVVGHPPGPSRILTAHPNPFRGSIQLQIRLGSAASTQLAVFDLSGRRVRTLIDGGLPPGDHSVEWNGRDDKGETLASGVYFLRLVTPGQTKTMRVLRLP